MKEALKQLFKTKIKKPVAHIRTQKIKKLLLLLFAAGFFFFFLFGKGVVENITLLDGTSLRNIRDMQMDKGAFFRYLCLSHVILIVFCGFFWWYQWGKACMYTLMGFGATTLGVCFAISIVRYHLKGILLWVVLYFPHTIFYFLALLCGVALSQNIGKNCHEKTNALLQNFVWLLGGLCAWLLGMYCESYVSSAILQNYLQYF